MKEVQRKESAPPARAIPEPPEVPLQIFHFEGQFIQVVVNQDPPAPPAPPAIGKDFKIILFSSFQIFIGIILFPMIANLALLFCYLMT